MSKNKKYKYINPITLELNDKSFNILDNISTVEIEDMFINPYKQIGSNNIIDIYQIDTIIELNNKIDSMISKNKVPETINRVTNSYFNVNKKKIKKIDDNIINVIYKVCLYNSKLYNKTFNDTEHEIKKKIGMFIKKYLQKNINDYYFNIFGDINKTVFK